MAEFTKEADDERPPKGGDLPPLDPFVDGLGVESRGGHRGQARRDIFPPSREPQQLYIAHECLFRQNIGLFNGNKSDDGPQCNRHSVGMAKKLPDPYAVECGIRLRATREALGYKTLREFADETGVTEDRLSSWERGVNRIDEEYVRRLKRRFKVTFEWIYDGDGYGLPADLFRKLSIAAS